MKSKTLSAQLTALCNALFIAPRCGKNGFQVINYNMYCCTH